jgi:flavin-dependent dehydrogenase
MLDTSREQGTKVFEETTVSRVRVDEPLRNVVHYSVPTDGSEGRIEAPFVVDASGQSAIVAHQLGFRVFDEELRFSAVWGYYDSSRYLDFNGNVQAFGSRFDTNPVTFVEAIGGCGWAWNIVLRNSVSVGFVLPSKRLRDSGETLEKRFLGLVSSTPYLSKLIEGAEYLSNSVRAIRNYSYKPVRLTVNNCY